MKEKQKNKLGLGIIIGVLIGFILGLCCFIAYDKLIVKDKNDTTIENNNSEIAETKVNNNIILFDSSKSLNSPKQNNYTLSCQGYAGIFVTVNSYQKELTFSFTPTIVVESYPLNWTSTKTDASTSIIKFDQKIIDIFFGGMGQDSSGDTLFILLEDGTVEYIPIVHMFNNTQAVPVSYGKINGVTDVTKFALSSTIDGVTTLAIKSDGSFYDLWYSLKDTGNY